TGHFSMENPGHFSVEINSMAFQIIMVGLLSFLLWFSLLRRYLASQLGVLSFMTPIFGITFGALILNDPLDGGFIAGAVLVLTGIFLVGGRDLFRKTSAATP
ncbi:EamA family transporter, partial [Sphingobium yanoikuyae]|uniref:EamA family transporter n=1 Tax=Sphingobium yanoikuyae TaxID=13690 RepID=UPI002FDC814E